MTKNIIVVDAQGKNMGPLISKELRGLLNKAGHAFYRRLCYALRVRRINIWRII